jgi:predicted TIM-barrel fold metal-dependent hydrolase
MEEQDISKSYLSISSPGVYLNVPSQNATDHAIALSRRVNEYASKVKAEYPTKFGFFASLPLPDIDAALAEIEYCFTKLEPKPDGVVLMSNFYGTYLGDPVLDPVYEAINALGVTILEHPTTPCTEANALRFQVNGSAPAISQAGWQALNRPIATRQSPAPELDFPLESARTFADLVGNEAPNRFPHIRWIIPHAGGALIPTFDRIILSLPLFSSANLTEAGLKEILAKHFYFDLAGPMPVTAAIPALLRWVDYTKLLYGSDTPWTPWLGAGKTAVAFDKDIDKMSDDVLDIDKARAIRRGNAKELLG